MGGGVCKCAACLLVQSGHVPTILEELLPPGLFVHLSEQGEASLRQRRPHVQKVAHQQGLQLHRLGGTSRINFVLSA